MDDVMATLLDLANILGGFLLAIALLRLLPRVGDDLDRGASALGAFSGVVGVVALVSGGYFLINHAVNGPHVFHFELVGIAVGILLLWSRLPWTSHRRLPGRDPATGHGSVSHDAPSERSSGRRAVAVGSRDAAVTGAELVLAVFGLIAIVVGIQGLFTPN